MTQPNSTSDSLAKVIPKTARAKRALDDQGSKVVENAKKVLFLKGTSCTEVVSQAMQDLCSLKKPDAVFFSRRNALHPFEMEKSENSIEFFSRKNDASLLVVGNHSKKRPQSLSFVRTFDHRVLDMVEFSIVGFRSIFGIGGELCGMGLKPAMMFQGEIFEQKRELKMIQNLFLDFFQGEHVSSLNLKGLESVICITGLEDRIFFRVYRVNLKKSTDSTSPRVELSLMGPALDLKIGRIHFPSDDLMRQACRVPKELFTKKVKNISRDTVGDQFGRIHVGKQEISKIQTRKVKALKSNRDKELGIEDDQE
jgi:ribosome production factor 2